MRVALFTETYTPAVNGVVAHVKTLKDGLEKLGHQVLVVTADKHARHHYIEDGVLHCPAAEIKRFYGFGAASPISRKRQKLISDFQPDIMHIHHEFGIGLSGIWAARAMKKPLVYTLHTMYDQYIYYIAPRMFLRTATKFSHKYNRFIARSATVLTGPSQKCEEYFKQIGVDKDMNLIPNSADLDAFNPKNIDQDKVAAFRKNHGIPDDALLICFCGRLGKEKSVDVLIQQLAETVWPEENMHLVVIGDGLEKDNLKQLAQELGVADRVTFTGLVNHKDMPASYAACDVYATASLSEMNSISMLESMATGLPVLQRFDELNKDQITEGKNGYLYHTAQELADRLKKINRMTPHEREALRQQVISTVEDRGSTDLAKYMLTVYDEAIQKKNSNTQ